MIQASDQLSLSGSACNRWVESRIQDHLGLLARILVSEVTEELKEADVAREVGFAETSEHPQIRLEEGEQALCAILGFFAQPPKKVYFRIGSLKQCTIAATPTDVFSSVLLSS